MSYGFTSYNGSDQVVINDTQPTYTKVRSGTLTGGYVFSAPSNTIPTYGYTKSGGASLSNNELILFDLGVGDWLCSTLMLRSDKEFVSNRSTLNYSVFAPRNDLPNPTGYGMAVYNNVGDCVWDSTTLLSRIYSSNVLPASTFPLSLSSVYTSQNFDFSGGVFVEGGTAYLKFNNVDFSVAVWGHAVERVSSTEARITRKQIFASGGNYQAGATARASSGMVYMAGSI